MIGALEAEVWVPLEEGHGACLARAMGGSSFAISICFFFITRPNFPHECASRFSDDDHDDGGDACMMTMTMTVMTHITTSFRKRDIKKWARTQARPYIHAISHS